MLYNFLVSTLTKIPKEVEEMNQSNINWKMIDWDKCLDYMKKKAEDIKELLCSADIPKDFFLVLFRQKTKIIIAVSAKSSLFPKRRLKAIEAFRGSIWKNLEDNVIAGGWFSREEIPEPIVDLMGEISKVFNINVHTWIEIGEKERIYKIHYIFQPKYEDFYKKDSGRKKS